VFVPESHSQGYGQRPLLRMRDIKVALTESSSCRESRPCRTGSPRLREAAIRTWKQLTEIVHVATWRCLHRIIVIKALASMHI
jgi:hypothetical protein